MNQMLQELETCRSRAVPLVAVNTIDVIDCYKSIKTEFAQGFDGMGRAARFASGFTWDAVSGVSAVQFDETVEPSELLTRASAEIGDPFMTDPLSAMKAMGAIASYTKPGKSAVFFMFLADRVITDHNGDILALIQELLMLRSELKKKGCMLILLGNMFSLPRELTDSFVVLTEDLPSLEQRLRVVQDTVNQYEETCAGQSLTPKVFTDDEKLKLAEAVSGASMFSAEQSLYLSLDRDGISLEKTLAKKLQLVEQTDGLTVLRTTGDGFDSLGGLRNIKNYFRRLIGGRMQVGVTVMIDEVDKSLAGSGGSNQDSSGVSQSFLGSLLTFMQDKQAYGSLFTGVYGAGKSAVAKAIGDESNTVTIQFDIAALKGSLVGESESKMRRALQVIESVAGDSKILFVATCNRIEQLPPELRRRFDLGTFFFYFPDSVERASIWRMYLKKYDIDPETVDTSFDENWTGAEIETCCRQAHLMDCTIAEAARYITPVHQIAKEEVESLVRNASGRYLSASYEGYFQANRKEVKRQEAKASTRSMKF